MHNKEWSMQSMSRRAFLRTSGRVAAGAAALGIVGPGAWGAVEDAAEASTQYGPLGFVFSYSPGLANAGTFVGVSNGFYKAAGFSKVTTYAGGATSPPPETMVATGKALIGNSSPDVTSAAILHDGVKLKTIAAAYQLNPLAITSMAKDPILTPHQLVGKKMGIPEGDETIWEAFCICAGVKIDSVTAVPEQYDPSPLPEGQVQGWLSYITNEPIALRQEGYDVKTLLCADYGYRLVSQSYIATDEAIKNHRDELKAILKAEIQGWTVAVTKPDYAAKLTVDTYVKGQGLTMKEEDIVAATQVPLIVTEETKKNGLLTMSPRLIEENLNTLAASGLRIKESDLFDTSLIDELYAEEPSLLDGIKGL